ncbi:membrane protease FtsH catalytic subunit [Longilinea arvoryzae]|uniref:ATP-dependent zinc metalloprotease FtsH n=1 Tax=Longilinea arvoryzae TaxID=360412 RepID=A0A0S7BIT7_9CHLR|nr:ATP-dependent zinc metalloprotease FtsH [Longilinea arvoryzae]GAP15677.1 membrane protease FtsH catalytic subunit [Longilinea arvoryzae]
MKKQIPEPDKGKSDKDSDSNNEIRKRQLNFGLSYLFVALIGMWLFQQFILTPLMIREIEIPYSELKAKIKAGDVIELTLGTDRIVGTMKNPNDTSAQAKPVNFTTTAIPTGDPALIQDLDQAGVKYSVAEPASPVGNFLIAYVLPLVLIGGIWYFGYRRLSKSGFGMGGMGGVMGVGKSKATEVKPEEIGVTYKDVGGADEAIEELKEIIQFLKQPESFARLGGRIPKGVLLIGPPGTGKTLLAKATAGEAQVPFFETSGSEFVEMFVGVGAARVRDLFEQARKAAPSIIFIDEIDAIGQSRGGAARFGGNDEREQTLNQLLSEIDGFRSEEGKPVIIMAATNRPEILDPALLRAGRFDRQVTVSAPDLTGRLQILRIHSEDIQLAPEFDLERAARITPGFTGADLANVMNEAALLAARRNADGVTMADFEASIERVVAGLEKKSRVMNEQERTTVAYHESGHALVAELVPHGDPVAKVSIVPRGRGALGYTMQMPTEDRYLMTRAELEDRIAVMLGGRAAEQVVFNMISTGASDDIKRASELARRMVTEFGMSDKLGAVRYATQQYQFLASEDTTATASPETLKMIDEEVQRIITQQYERAQNLLQEHHSALEWLTRQLLKTETVDGSVVKQALAE